MINVASFEQKELRQKNTGFTATGDSHKPFYKVSQAREKEKT